MNFLMEGWSAVRASMKANRGIAWGVWWNVGLLVASVAVLPFDSRKILGLNPWIKPTKFEISVILFLLTVGLMLWGLEDVSERLKARLGWAFGLAMLVENSLIAMQSARGVRSHMNFSTPLDGMIFALMGLMVVVNSIGAGWLLALWMRTQAHVEIAVVWGIRLGLLMLLVGSLGGVHMVLHGAHTVGAEDGSAGLPFVNWSRQYGDLRIAHFFALHALQLFPLAGMAVAATRWKVAAQKSAVVGFSLVYGAGVWWLFAEAMKGLALVKG